MMKREDVELLEEFKKSEEEAEKAKKKALLIKQLEEEKILEEKILRAKVEAELKAKEEARLALKLMEQKKACAKFVNTEFEELKLLNGRTLESAVVTAADSIKVTFMHSSGVAKIEYAELPKEICDVCKFDVELMELELKRRQAEEDEKLRKIQERRLAARESGAKNASRPVTQSRKTTKNPASTSRKTHSTKTEKKKIIPNGRLSVRVTSVSRGNKTILVTAKTNVDAILYLNDWYYHRYYKYSVTAGQVYQHTWSNVGSKYEVKLVDKKGKLLDSESHSRKTGLGTNGGL